MRESIWNIEHDDMLMVFDLSAPIISVYERVELADSEEESRGQTYLHTTRRDSLNCMSMEVITESSLHESLLKAAR